jgi:hypothetical protein
VAGERRSTILRPDGSTLAVTVPAGGMDESDDSAGWGHDWITGAVEPCPPGLTLLHRAVLVDLSDGPSIETCRSGREAP